MSTDESPRPLHISIVGAGIGGLTAAIALRRNGHRVRIFESQTKTEIEAGIAVQLNAVRILERLGYSRDNLKAVHFDGMIVFDSKTGDERLCPWQVARPDGTHDLMCHRSDLRYELRRLAMGEEGEGPPVQLSAETKVIDCDPEAGTVTLSSGEIIHADVVIGADGINSTIRTSVLGQVLKAPSSGLTCFRCVFDASNLDKIPDLKWFAAGFPGGRNVVAREQSLRTFFTFPCRSGTLINFAAFYQDSEQDSTDWTPTATLEEIRAKYHDFHPMFLRLLDLPTDTDTPILKWQLRAMPILPTWVRGRTALLGDAAHATLPMLGQGAVMAIEDAAALGCLLPLGTAKEDVPARLEAYERLRKERVDFVNTESVAQAVEPAKRGLFARSRELQALLVEHDIMKIAQEYHDVHFGGGVKA